MSGRRLMIAGRLATVPDDQYDALVQQLDKDGVDFGPPPDVAKRAELAGVEPGGPPARGGASPGFEPDPNIQPVAADDDMPSWLRGLTSDMNRDPNPNPALMAGYSGAFHGATMGADNLIPAVRESNDQARAASPGIYDAADAISGLLVGGGGSIPRQIGMAGAQGFVRDFSDADPEQEMAARTTHAMKTGGESAAAAGVLTAGAGLVGGAANLFGRGAEMAGDAARLRAWDTPAAELAAHGERYGLPPGEAVRDFVQRGEDLVPPNKIVPMTPAQINARAQPVATNIGRAVDENLGAAASQGAHLPEDIEGLVQRNLYGQADQALANRTAAGVPMQGALMNEAEAAGRATQMGAPPLTDPRDVRATKTALQKVAFKGAPGSPESFAGQAAESAANQYRGVLDDYVAQASPDVQQGYGAATRDYGIAQGITNSTAGATYGQAAGSGTGMLPASPSGIMRRAMSAVPGAAFDGAANAARLGEGAASIVAAPANWIARDAPTGAGVAELISAATADRSINSRTQSTQDPQSMNDQPAKDTRGYLVPKAIQRHPEYLGKYQQEFANLTNEDQFAATIERLARDPSDPDFAMRVLPIYEGMTR